MSETSNNIVHVGLAGFGSWARMSYVPLLAELPNIRVVGVAARSEQTRSAAADVFGGDVALHASYDGLIEAGGLDAVMVALTPALNAKAAVAALEHGLHVFMEPPFADPSDTQRVLELANNGNPVFHSDVEPRYLPLVATINGLFGSEGVLGQLRSFSLDHEMLLSSEYSGSSIFFGLGPWYVDLLDAFAQSPADRIELVPGRHRNDGLLVTGQTNIGYESGVTATWHFGFEGPSELGLSVSLTGDKGEVQADLTTGEYRWRLTGDEWQSATADCSRPEAGFIGMRESIHAFLAAIRGEGKTMSGPDVIRRTQPVLLELQRQETALNAR
jgi:predicted dehydrogenase